MGSAETPKLFTGVNVENASYPVGLCAERCAISTAVAAGFSRITAIAVSTDAKPPASPCGMCRQFMREFVVDGQVPIIMIGGDGIRSEFTAKSFEEVSTVPNWMRADVLMYTLVVTNEFWSREFGSQGLNCGQQIYGMSACIMAARSW